MRFSNTEKLRNLLSQIGLQADSKSVSKRTRAPPTPKDVQAALNCTMRCCRAPEMAAGDPIIALRERLQLGSNI